MIDTEELRRLAQAATHPTTKGRWMRLFGERTVYDRMEDGCRGVPIVAADHHPPGPQAAAYLDFIAAANPAAIIELLDRLEAAERKRDELLAVCRGLLNAHRITFAKPPSTVEQAHRQLDLIEKAVSAAETAIAEAQGKEK